jgi:hypothetical protein
MDDKGGQLAVLSYVYSFSTYATCIGSGENFSSETDLKKLTSIRSERKPSILPAPP